MESLSPVSMQVESIEKRCISQVILSLQREGILRGGKTARLQSPFISANDVSAESSLQTIQAFPYASQTATNTSQFVHGGNLNATGLILGINDGMTPSSSVLPSPSLLGGQS